MPPDLNPNIVSVGDVGNDQGRIVRIKWSASRCDTLGSSTPITAYTIWRRIDPLPLAMSGLGPSGSPPDFRRRAARVPARRVGLRDLGSRMLREDLRDARADPRRLDDLTACTIRPSYPGAHRHAGSLLRLPGRQRLLDRQRRAVGAHGPERRAGRRRAQDHVGALDRPRFLALRALEGVCETIRPRRSSRRSPGRSTSTRHGRPRATRATTCWPRSTGAGISERAARSRPTRTSRRFSRASC